MKATFVFVLIAYLFQPSQGGWDIFAKVKFTERFHKELNEYYLVPFLDSRITSYEGKKFKLTGHYMPFDIGNQYTVILSKYPYSQCFFCGGAGPESVAEIVFASKPPKFNADQLITVHGILKLNDKDINRMNFILEQAELEQD